MTDLNEQQRAGQFTGLIYASLIAISTLRGYFRLVNIPWYVSQFCYIGVILLGITWIFFTGNTKRLNTSVNVMAFQTIPHIIMVVWSIAIWVWNKEPFSLIIRGSSLLIYQILVIVMLIAPGAMFGKKAIEYTAQGFILSNTLVLLDVMRRFGVGTTITGLIQFLSHFGSVDSQVSTSLEVQDVTFGMAILLVYYIADGKDEHWRKFYIAALTFYLFTGLKRIIFPAFAIALVYLFLTRKMSRNNQVKFSVAIGLFIIAVSFAYIIMIKTEVWFAITERFGINLMGRKRLYTRVESYYTISPIYMGLGNGTVSKILEAVEITGNRRLHGDVLRLYIELGMPMFILWNLVVYIFTYTFLNRTYSLRSARMYFAIALFMFVTFLTDNTIEKFCPQIAWHVLPLAIVLADKEAFADSLNKRSLLLKNEKQKA